MSTSSTSVTTSTVNGVTRATGLSSGIDVDSIVSGLMTAERAKKLNKLEQKEQTATWKQTDYRTMISDIQTFSSKYFTTGSSSSLLSTSNFLKYTATSADSAVTVTAASTASAASHTIEVTQLATKGTLTSSASVSKDVQASATPTYTSGQSFVLTLDGTAKTITLDSSVTNASSLQTAINTAVGSDKVTISTNSSGYLTITAADSGVNAITISAPTSSSSTSALTNLGFSGTSAVLSNRLSTSDTLSTIAGELSSALSSTLTFDTDGQVDLTINGTTLTVDKTDTLADMMSTINKSDAGVTMTYNSVTGKLAMTADSTGAGSTVAVTESGSTFVSALLSSSTAGLDAKVTLDGQSLTRSSNTITVDGVTYTANATTTTASAKDTLASAITSATSGTTTTNKTAVTTAYTAYAAALAAGGTTATTAATLVSTKNTLDSAIATLADGTLSTALTAYNTAAGTAIDTAATNESAADSTTNETAVTAAITAASATDSSTADTVSVTQDTDGVYDLIKSFVDDYNTLISTINTELSETADSDYQPLTDDQKSSMTDTEITAWETKAKVGLLESDSTLKDFVSGLRSSLIDSISGQSTTLSSIGITTGSYDTKGTLSIDEDTLTAAIASDPETVMKLFTQQATSTTSTGTSLAGTTIVRSLSSSNLATRYKEEGIAYRFYDTIQKNISSIQDSAGNKGTLLEEAGITNDASDTDNTLTTLIDKYTTEISTEKTRLDTVEDNLYTKYSNLETYINKMNTQLSSLSSMTSSS